MVNRIRVLRAETKTSQTTLGRRARMSQTMLNHIENGKREPTSGEQKRIAKALRNSVEAVFPSTPLIGGDDEPRRKLTRNERLQGLADRGVDTCEEEIGER
jgi:transcriptional regulator with XRE-family HTH domain